MFNIFKKKSEEDKNLSTEISKYNEYIKYSLVLQQEGDYAPLAAYEDDKGKIIGHAYVNADKMYTISAKEIVKKMTEHLGEELSKQNIKSYVVIYHSANDANHSPATIDEELKAISIKYNLAESSLNGIIDLPYKFENNNIIYNKPEELTNDIFNVELIQGQDYFTDKVDIIPEEKENSIGIKVRISNNTTVSDTWAGIVGFTEFNEGEGQNYISKLVDDALKNPPIYNKNGVEIAELNSQPLKVHTITFNGRFYTSFPIIETDYKASVETLKINEWTDIENTLAIVSGQANETFGVKFLATDYAKNREKYLNEKFHNILLSAVVFVLDKHELKEDDKISEDFTRYFPHKEMNEFGCFDFIGKIRTIQEVKYIGSHNIEAYLLKVQLINLPENADMFTIDMFVNKENMRFENLEEGMNLTGMFQLQGRMAE